MRVRVTALGFISIIQQHRRERSTPTRRQQNASCPLVTIFFPRSDLYAVEALAMIAIEIAIFHPARGSGVFFCGCFFYEELIADKEYSTRVVSSRRSRRHW